MKRQRCGVEWPNNEMQSGRRDADDRWGATQSCGLQRLFVRACFVGGQNQAEGAELDGRDVIPPTAPLCFALTHVWGSDRPAVLPRYTVPTATSRQASDCE